MKDCPRCGFLNPDRAEYCMKCRFLMGAAQAPGADPGPMATRPTGPTAPPEEPSPGVGGFDEPPDWAARADLLPPPPDLDDTMQGRGFASGGYDIGGGTSGPYTGPAPGDAFAIMTGGSAPAPSDVYGDRPAGSGDERRKGRRSGRRPRGKQGRSDGLPPPPDPSAAYTPAFAVDPVQPPFAAPAPQPPLRRPVPRAPSRPVAPRQTRARRPGVDMEAVLSRLKALASPRYLVAAVACAMLLVALAYMVAGGSYFAGAGQKSLGAAEAAMAGVSYHLDANVAVTTGSGVSRSGKVAVDVAGDGAFHAVYAGDLPGLPLYREYIRSGGKAWELSESGAWEPSRATMDFSPRSLLGSASGARVITGQPGGTGDEQLAFHGATGFVAGLLPEAETTDVTRADVEVRLDAQHHPVMFTANASGFEQKDAGSFSCHVEATLGNFGAPLEIKPPV
ncbi:MAG: hypothetical protein KKF41_07175 [Actinobacteria bacterium]|nr:hypothetical protein [Actinomycetota bacterium]